MDYIGLFGAYVKQDFASRSDTFFEGIRILDQNSLRLINKGFFYSKIKTIAHVSSEGKIQSCHLIVDHQKTLRCDPSLAASLFIVEREEFSLKRF